MTTETYQPRAHCTTPLLTCGKGVYFTFNKAAVQTFGITPEYKRLTVQCEQDSDVDEWPGTARIRLTLQPEGGNLTLVTWGEVRAFSGTGMAKQFRIPEGRYQLAQIEPHASLGPIVLEFTYMPIENIVQPNGHVTTEVAACSTTT